MSVLQLRLTAFPTQAPLVQFPELHEKLVEHFSEGMRPEGATQDPDSCKELQIVPAGQDWT